MKEMSATEIRKEIERKVKKNFIRNNYSPLWMTQSIDGYFKKGASNEV